jgi:hypothetical protein
MYDAIYIGHSPAGVVWNCHRKPGETRDSWVARAGLMRARLKDVHARVQARRKAA